MGKAGMKVSGKTTRWARPTEAARVMSVMAFWVVRGAERKEGEAWQAAMRRIGGMLGMGRGKEEVV